MKRTLREKKLFFSEVVMLLINLIKRSLKVELQDFLAFGLRQEISYTKSAFCQSREKIKPVFFQDLNQKLVELVYEKNTERIKKWKGFLLVGVDGSTAYLPNNKDTSFYFGTQSNQYMEVPMARIIKFHDVLNDFSVFSKIAPIVQSESVLFKEHLHQLPKDSIGIFDRGFPSFSLCFLMMKNERKFVMRTKLSFSKMVEDFVKSEQWDKEVNWLPNANAIKDLKMQGYEISMNTPLKIRLIKVLLNSGETEVLMTNLYDENEYRKEDFSQLYFKRWGVETRIDADKNKTQMEEFSGQKPLSIEQDFYCMEFVMNLQSMIAMDCQMELQEISKGRKHLYKINKNVSIGSLKYRIVELFCNSFATEIPSWFIKNSKRCSCKALSLSALEGPAQESLKPLRKKENTKR